LQRTHHRRAPKLWPKSPTEVPSALSEGSGAGGAAAAGARRGGDAWGHGGGSGHRGGAGDGGRGPRSARPAGEEEGAHQEEHK